MPNRKAILFGAGGVCIIVAIALSVFNVLLFAGTSSIHASDEVCDIGLFGSALIVLGILYACGSRNSP